MFCNLIRLPSSGKTSLRSESVLSHHVRFPPPGTHIQCIWNLVCACKSSAFLESGAHTGRAVLRGLWPQTFQKTENVHPWKAALCGSSFALTSFWSTCRHPLFEREFLSKWTYWINARFQQYNFSECELMGEVTGFLLCGSAKTWMLYHAAKRPLDFVYCWAMTFPQHCSQTSQLGQGLVCHRLHGWTRGLQL